MTPSELLEEAKARFIVLYHSDETDLERLLRLALGKFQDKAGSVSTVKLDEDGGGIAPLPSDFLSISMAVDKRSVYHDCHVEHDVDGDLLVVDVDDETEYPVTVRYFQNLRDWPLGEELPNGIIGLVLDYLVALIDIPNTERERGVAMNTGQQMELPSKQELQERVNTIELIMEESQAIVMPVSVW
jgi:hypothetical protein